MNEPQNTSAPIPLRWRIRAWLFRELFADEYTELNNAVAARDYSRRKLVDLQDREAARTAVRRPARFRLEGGLSEELIAARLRGTQKSGVIEAVLAHIAAKVVGLSDRATDSPYGERVTAEGVTPAFTADERLHLAGQAAGVAEILRELQELTAPEEEEKKAP